MLTLYYKPTCKFSARVLAVAEGLGVPLHLKDISADDTLKEELIARGGKKQVPYLVDEERNTEMYESRDIIAHLTTHYSSADPQDFAAVRVHRSAETCDVEE